MSLGSGPEIFRVLEDCAVCLDSVPRGIKITDNVVLVLCNSCKNDRVNKSAAAVLGCSSRGSWVEYSVCMLPLIIIIIN